MKKIISLAGAVLIAAASLGGAGGFEELRPGAALGAFTPEQVKAIEIPMPGQAKVSLHPGDGAVRLAVTAPGGMKVSASAIYMARTNSRACTEFSWNEGSGGRPPKRIYPVFPAVNGAITIPEGMGTECDYGRVDEGTLSFSLPGRAEPYNTVAVLRGGGAGEQQVRCEVIDVLQPSGGVKAMVNCYGDVRLDASNQARVRVVMGKEASFKSAEALSGPKAPADFSGGKLVEFGSVCDLGKNPTDAVSSATMLLNEPIIRLQTNVNVWTSATYTATYIQAPYKVLGEASVTRISAVAKYNWLACIPVQGRIR